MKQDTSPDRTNNKDTQPNEHQIPESRTLFITTLIISVFVVGSAIFAVVEICKAWLSAPKDTEVGVMAVVATITLFAIVGQMLVNALQWKAAQNQWKAMQEGLVKTQAAIDQSEQHFNVLNRPILNITKIKWLHKEPNAGMGAGKHWRLNVEFRNYGGMIAHTILNDSTLEPIPYVYSSDPCPDPVLSINPKKGLVMAVAPQSKFTVTIEKPKLSAEDFDAIWSDDWDKCERWKKMALWIDLTYTDPVGKSYDFRYHALFNRANFVPCREHCYSE